jgi:hypothetical protein
MRFPWEKSRRLVREGILKEYKTPNPIYGSAAVKIFLAGTIDMGNSEDWQSQVTEAFKKTGTEIEILNPRIDDWDSSWKQTIDDPQFYQQVNWELNAMDKADYILMNFLPDSKSPITLLELGLYADSGKLLVICPDEFYRSGNVHIVCDKYNIPLVKSLKELEL